MNDYIFFMHNDARDIADDENDQNWEPYLAKLRASGNFSGGSAIGDGACFRKNGPPPEITAHISGYIVVKAASLSEAKKLLAGNPVYEARGTVEVRELPRTN
jgi:hypothetical protein